MSHDTADHRQGKPRQEGFVMIPESVCDTLARIKLAPSESRLLWAVLRKTWRYQKDADWITDTQIAAITGMDRTQVNKAKKSLVLQKKLLFRDGRRIGVNKNVQTWSVADMTHVSEPSHPRDKTDNNEVADSTTKRATAATHRRRDTKDSPTIEHAERERQFRTMLLDQMGLDDFAESLDEQWPVIRDFMALTDADGEMKAGRKWRGVKRLDHFRDIRHLKKLFGLYKSSRH